MSIIEQALAADDDDTAAKLIQDALGITDGGIAGYSFPVNWPTDRAQRAAVLAEWLGNECRFAV